MGWERKRGKLHELNRLLRGAADTTFIAAGGHPPVPPPGVRYVITLDADTRMPREAARKWDRENIFPREVFGELGRMGVMGLTVPEEYGGQGVDIP
jgi:cyclic beta-1,2-glucan synthetase